MKIIKPILISAAALAVVLYALWRWYDTTVADKTPPVLSCATELAEVSVHDRQALFQGVTAVDDRDGDISDQIMLMSVSQLTGPDTARVTYVVFDSSDNMAVCSRSVRYLDYEKPRFSLSAPLIYSAGQIVTLSDRLTAEDDIDGDLSDSIRVTTASVLTSAEGSYTMTVQVTNSMGDTSILPLTILIDNGSFLKPFIGLTDYLVYLSVGDDFDARDYFSYVRPTAESAEQTTLAGVTVSSAVNTAEAGVYEASYFYTNQHAETCQTILTVVVR